MHTFHQSLHGASLAACGGTRFSGVAVLTVYGRQQRVEVGYNPKKRGRPCYLPLMCSEGITQDCWEGSYNPGNTHVSTITIPLLGRAFAKLPEPIRAA